MLSVVFNYIVASSIIGCVITAIILLIKNIFKTKQNANWHYYIWFILLLRLIIPYMPQSSFSILNSLSPAVEKISVNQISLTEYSIKPLVHKNSISTVSHKTYTNANGNEAVITYNNTKHDNSNQTYKAVNIKEILAYVWLGGFLLLSGYVCYINLRFQRKLKNASLVHDQTIDTVLKECKTSLNITKDISVFITREVSVPSLWGCIKPCILLPENMQGMLDIIKLRHILYHELSHYRRKDNITNWFVGFAKALHWFNPFIWFGFFKMRQDCEIACDALAMSNMNTYDQTNYGYTILHLVKISSNSKLNPSLSGIVSSKSNIKRRITMISSFNKKALKHSYLGILMLAILGCLLLTNGKSNAVQQSSSTKLQKAIPLSSYKKSNLEAFANKSKLNSVLYSHASKDGKISITIDEVKGKNFKGKVMLVSDPQKIAVGYSLKNNKVNKTTSEIAKMNNSLAAINGGAYFYDSSPVGFIISNGNLAFYKPDISVRRSKIATVGFNDKGKLIVGSYSLNQIQKLGIKEGTSSLLTLISNGVVNKIISTQGWGIAPRTAIGQKKDGTVVFLTIDGRSLASIGATIKEVTAILKQFDVINGALLDGGSSTTMYYNGKVISHPCDISHFKPYIRHAECKVPSIFFVKP